MQTKPPRNIQAPTIPSAFRRRWLSSSTAGSVPPMKPGKLILHRLHGQEKSCGFLASAEVACDAPYLKEVTLARKASHAKIS